MRLRESREKGVDVLELEGEIDMHFAPVLRRLLQSKRDKRCPSLLLDMTAITFIDSTGLAVILEYVRDTNAYEGRFCIGGASENLRTIFEIVRLDRAIPIYHDASAAKKALVSHAMPAVSEPLFASAA